MPIVYDAGLNMVTVSGFAEAAPCTFNDVWLADQAGGWGVVSKLGSAQFLFACFLQIGDGSTQTYFAGLNAQVVFADGVKTANNQILIRVMRYAVFRLGALDDAARKRTSSGCAVWDAGQTYYCSLIRPASDAADCEIYLYSSQFRGLYTEAWVEGRHMYNLLCDGRAYPHFTTYTTADVHNVIVSGGPFGIRMPKAGIAVNNLFIMTTSSGIWVRTYQSATLKNVYARQNTRLVYMEKMGTTEVDSYLINVDSDNWTILWSAATASKIYRQYEFILAVTDKHGVGISGASVVLKDKDGNTVFTATTNAEGAITTQTVTRGYYTQATGSTLQDASPHTLTIAKAGYQTYTVKFTLTEKTRWTIKLAKAATVLNGMGQPILNLKPTDPENTTVLPL